MHHEGGIFMKKWFRNLMVGKKINVGFGVILAFMGLIGLTGYVSMSLIEQKLDNIFQIQLPSINYILEADRDLFQSLVAERTMMFAEPESDQFAEFQAFYQENLQQSQQRIEKYMELATTDQERELFPSYEAARAEWEAVSAKVLHERIQAQEWKTQQAIGLSLGEANEKFEAMREYLDELTEMNQQLAADAHHDAQTAYRITLFVFLLLAIFGVVAGLGLAFLIGTGITMPLSEAVSSTVQIAEGDLTTQIDVQTTDETGQLLKAMKHMADILKSVVREGNRAAPWPMAASNSVRWPRKSLREPVRKPLQPKNYRRQCSKWSPTSIRTPIMPCRRKKSPFRPRQMRRRCRKP
jgi:methyl-accepting chemotaxis protein